MAEVEKALLLVSQTECSKLNLKEGSIEMSLNVLDGDVLKEAISVVAKKAEDVDAELSRITPLLGPMQASLDTLDQAAGALEIRVETLEKDKVTPEMLNASIEREVKRLVDLFFEQLEMPSEQGDAVRALQEQIAQQADSVQELYRTKAEKEPTRRALDLKADKSDLASLPSAEWGGVMGPTSLRSHATHSAQARLLLLSCVGGSDAPVGRPHHDRPYALGE